MKVKRMGITEILRRIWLFSANKIKSSESFSKQPSQLIVELNSSLRHIIVTIDKSAAPKASRIGAGLKYRRSPRYFKSIITVNIAVLADIIHSPFRV